MVIRLLHTADWQLGKSFGNVPGDAGALLREARFDAVGTLAALASEHAVDAVLVAGDVFDHDTASDRTLQRAISRMSGFAGPWILLPGNHDAAKASGLWSRLAAMGPPANILLAIRPEPIVLLDGQLTVLPAPLTERRTHLDLTAWMDQAPSLDGAVRVGLAHGSVAGRLSEAADAGNPIAPDRSQRAALDYLALGDWHGCQEIALRSWYSGTPEPDRAKDNDSGLALLVEIAAKGAQPIVQRLKTGRYQWHALRLGATGGGLPGLADALLGGIGAPERAVVFLELAGTTGLAERAGFDAVCQNWAARLHHLEINDRSRLAAAEADLMRLEAEPALARVVARLREALGDPEEQRRGEAAMALQILWREVERAGGVP